MYFEHGVQLPSAREEERVRQRSRSIRSDFEVKKTMFYACSSDEQWPHLIWVGIIRGHPLSMSAKFTGL